MPRLEIPLQSAQNDTKPLSSERLVNMYAEQAPRGAVSQIVLQPHPGLVAVTTALGSVYGLAVHNGSMYAATAAGLYKVTPAGVATVQAYSGSISSAGTTILYNGISFYCAPSQQATYMDGYFLRMETSYLGRFAWAGPYSTTWDALDFATAEGAPDGLVGILAAHRELWLFGAKTTEIWYNSGNRDLTFERMPNAFVERGALGGIALVGSAPYWLGDDGLVYRANGYLPERISTASIEQRIADQSDAPRGFSITINGHQIYVLRFGGLCLCYDTTTGLWHERNTWQTSTWDATCSEFFDGVNYIGTSSGLYRLDDSIYSDDGATLERRVVTPPLFVDDAYARMARVELLAEMGVGLTTGQGSDPQVMLRWSDDGGRTWSHEHWRSLGQIGEYKQRARWWRMGRFRERTFELVITDPVRVSILGMSAVINA